MIVDPYKLRPVPPRVAVLVDERRAVSETGVELELDDFPPDHRLWAGYELVYRLVREGHGEALCWNQEEIRWRHRRRPDEYAWRRRPSDANVIKLPFPDRPDEQLAGLVGWRDWLAANGASPEGTTGSAGWSLLRATLDGRLWCSGGSPPPLIQTMGGRQELGPAGPGRFHGRLEHLDLPAAYASTLAAVQYGGRWVSQSELGQRLDPWVWAADDRMVFVRARVRLPDALYGPLPRRPRRRVHGLSAFVLSGMYPRGGRLQGLWAWPELEAAIKAGARLLEVVDVWTHFAAGRRPFERWWAAILEGRAMSSTFGANLAKITGNSLWGRFCMDPDAHASRTIRGANNAGVLVGRPAGGGGGTPAAHDLAEYVSGTVRGRLLELVNQAGDELVCVHTDGGWVKAGVVELDGWRSKEHATRLDLIGPQVMRYWRVGSRGEPFVVYSGVPAELAPAAFARKWEGEGFPP